MEKTLIIKERKNDWAIQVKITGGAGAFAGTSTLATFAKRPMGLIMAGNAFNHMLKTMFVDHKMLIASAEGLQSLYSVGVEPILEDAT